MDENLSKLRSLNGDYLEKAVIIEFALFEDPLVWRRADLPLIHTLFIEFELQSGRIPHFSTYQADDGCGIVVSFVESTSEARFADPVDAGGASSEENSMYRVVRDGAFPSGIISNIQHKFDDDGDVTEIFQTIGCHEILLKAGEVYEGWDDYRLCSRDENILLFLNPADAIDLPFDKGPVKR